MENRGYEATILRIVTAALLSLGCSAENSNKDDQAYQYVPSPTNATDGADTPVEEAFPSAGVESVQAGNGGRPTAVPDATVVDLPLDVDAACATFSAAATQREVQVPHQVEVEVVVPEPVALFLMLDQSGSMTELSGLSIKWLTAVTAINQFVADSPPDSLDIALQYFPLILGDCVTGFGYSVPEVPMGRLPDNASAISTSLACHIPGAGGSPYTPIEGALRGATGFCSQFVNDRNANPDGESCVAVLVTDGLPTVCNQDPNVLIGIAANAYAVSNVRTYTIGMDGADFALLDQIARAGNGDCTPNPLDFSWACNVSAGGTTFLDALETIRGSVVKLEIRTETQTVIEYEKLDCEWAIPDPPVDQTVDKNQVNVQFLPNGQSQGALTFGRVDSEAHCRDSTTSWFYDDPNNPTAIVACPRTCDSVKTADTGKINILLGCDTVLTIY